MQTLFKIRKKKSNEQQKIVHAKLENLEIRKIIAKATIKDKVTEFVEAKDWQFFLVTLLCICDVFTKKSYTLYYLIFFNSLLFNKQKDRLSILHNNCLKLI